MAIAGVVLVVVLLVILSISVSDKQDKYRDGNMVLKLIYTFLIGIFLAVFIGVGIAAFYPEPKFPEPPMVIKYCSSEMGSDLEQFPELKTQLEEFDREEKVYQQKSQIYNRNVSIAALIASILIVVASLTLFRKILLIADGLLLGGVLTLIYSVMRGFGTQDNMFRFIVVTFGLIISLALGYVKFIKPSGKASSK